MQLPMLRDLIILSLDGSCAVEDHLEEGLHSTVLSIVDHYMGRPESPHFNRHFWNLSDNTPCPRLLELNQLPGVDVLSSLDRMGPYW